MLPAGLAAFLDGLDDDWAGLSLTMPLKQTVLPLLDDVSPLAAATGAANTLVLRDGRRSGHNTDVAGMVRALREARCPRVGRGVVLGGGATAASALAALAELGERAPTVLVREPSRAGPLREAAERLQVAPLVRRLADADAVLAAGPDLVISTLPAGAADALATGRLPAGLLLDVVYAPWPTALARVWGPRVVGGAQMLLHQAAEQVALMTGRPAPLEAMRAALP